MEKDHYLYPASDCFAFGVILYSMYFYSWPSTSESPEDADPVKFSKKLVKGVDDHLKPMSFDHSKDSFNSVEFDFLNLIKDLLAIDHTKRSTTFQCKTLLKSLFDRYVSLKKKCF